MAGPPNKNNYGSINADRVPSVGFSGTRNDPKKILDLIDVVTSQIVQINSESKSLGLWTRSLGTARDSPELRNKILNAETVINELVGKASQNLGSLNNLSRGTDKAMKLQINKLMEDFKDTAQLCSLAQKTALDKLRTTYLPSEVALMEGSDSNNGSASYLQAGQTTAEQRQATNALKFETGLLKEREQRIAAIERNIIDVNQIMKEIGAYVYKQAEDINSIENAIESTQQDVELAEQELEKSSAYVTRRRKRNCFLLSLAGAAAFVLVLIIVLSLH